MRVSRFDPFNLSLQTLARMDRELDDLARRGWGAAEGPVRAAVGFVPPVEVRRDGEDVVVRLELPGVDVERDVTIEVERGRLVISGERRQSGEDDEGVLLRELRYGQFRREFALPAGISPEQVDASYDAGLLDVRVRAVAPEPQSVRVPITTGRPSQAQVVEGSSAGSEGASAAVGSARQDAEPDGATASSS